MPDRKLLSGFVIAPFCLVSVGASAFAADLPTSKPAPVFAPPAAFTWTGFYFGVNAGAAFGNSDPSATPSSLWYTSGFPTDLPNAAAIAAAPATLRSSSFVGGATAGYNLQLNSVVVGLEGDFDYMGLRSSHIAGPSVVPGGALSLSVNDSIKTNYLATVRGRVGYAFDRFLIYGTAGVAISDPQFSAGVVFGAGATYVGSRNITSVGFAGGAGMEYAVTNNWTVKLEYLYADLGKANFTAIKNPHSNYAVVNSEHLDAQLVRAGVNYRF